MTHQRTLVVNFMNTTAAEGNRYATDLMNSLLRSDPTIQVQRHREREDAQDFGSALVLVLSTTAVTVLAQGVATWLRRNAGVRISVKTLDGSLVADGLDSKDVAHVVEALSAALNSRES